MFITSLPYSTICNKCADIFQKNATLVFLFNLMHLSTYLFFCVFISPSFYSVFICSTVLRVYLYFMIFSTLLLFNCLSPIQLLWEQRCFHHSCHILLSKTSIISHKLECLCETGGCWVGESERMLFVLAAYGHFHWHEATLTSNPFLSCTLNLC